MADVQFLLRNRRRVKATNVGEWKGAGSRLFCGAPGGGCRRSRGTSEAALLLGFVKLLWGVYSFQNYKLCPHRLQLTHVSAMQIGTKAKSFGILAAHVLIFDATPDVLSGASAF